MKFFEKYQFKIKNTDGSYSVVPKKQDSLILADFLGIWNSSKDIKEEILPDVNLILNGDKQSTEFGADVVGLIYIQQKITKLITSDLGSKDMQLPKEDFKHLLLEWTAFLESKGR